VLLNLDTQCYVLIVFLTISRAIRMGTAEHNTGEKPHVKRRGAGRIREGAYQLTDVPISRVIQHTFRNGHQGSIQTEKVLHSVKRFEKNK
jgi:hypothetical protein